jgi:hypothetical protein
MFSLSNYFSYYYTIFSIIGFDLRAVNVFTKNTEAFLMLAGYSYACCYPTLFFLNNMNDRKTGLKKIKNVFKNDLKLL